MSANKTAVRWGVKVAKESVYNTFVIPGDATDGVLVFQEPVPDEQWKFPGVREGVYGATGPTKQLPPAGRFATVPVVQEVTSPPSPYAGTFLENARISIHRVLELNGYVAAFSATGGPNSTPRHSFIPLADPGAAGTAPYDSGSASIYAGRQQFDLAGCYVSELEIAADSIGSPLRCTAQLTGTMPTEPVDIVAYPTITYSHYNRTPIRLLNPEITSLPGYTSLVGLRLKAFRFRSIRELSERGADHGGNHAGWTMGPWRQELIVTLEAGLLTAGNPRAARTLGTTGALGITFGGITVTPFTGVGNRINFATNDTAQVIDFNESRDGKTVLWETTYLAAPVSLDSPNGINIFIH